jgi:hypothetical protein
MFSVLIRPFGFFTGLRTTAPANGAAVLPVALRSTPPVRLRWQSGSDGCLRCTWEALATPQSEDEPPSGRRTMSLVAWPSSTARCLSSGKRGLANTRRTGFPIESSNATARAPSRRHSLA